MGTAMSENVNLTRQAGSSMESKRVPGQLLEPKSSTIYKISDPLLKFAPLQRNEWSLIFMERQRILTTIQKMSLKVKLVLDHMA